MKLLFKRALALVLTLCLMLPLGAVMPVQAEETAATAKVEVEYSFVYLPPLTADTDKTYAALGTAQKLETLATEFADGNINSAYIGKNAAKTPNATTNGIICASDYGEWIAFKIKSPGTGAFKISVTHFTNSKNTDECSVYILPDTEVANIETVMTTEAAVCLGTTNLSDSNNLTEALENSYNFAQSVNYVLVFKATQDKNGETTTGTDAEIRLAGLTMTSVDSTDVNTALSAATTKFHTVKLQTSGTANAVDVSTNATLDLNGYSLTAASVNAAATGAQVIDSSDGTGILTVAKDSLSANGDNGGYLPLYDETGYRFYQVTVNSIDADTTSVENVAKLRFQVKFENTAAYALIVEGATGMSIKGAFGGSVENTGSFTYADGTDFAAAWANVASQKSGKVAIVVTLSGLEAVDSLTLTPSVYNAGVSISGDALTAK